MKAIFGRRSGRLAVTALAVFGIAAGIAYATTTDAGTVYTACKLNATGTIRMIEPSESGLKGRCTSLETKISWNEKGQDGASGLAGPAGPAGPQGPVGPQGPQGNDAVISPDSITTAEIRNGTIKGEDVATVDADGLTGANVKDATLTQDDLAPNAVASSEIADGAIGADDLANGSVTTDKQKANVGLSLLGSPPLLVVPATPGAVTASGASATIDVAGGSHSVLVMGQAQILGTPVGADVMTVSVQLFEGATPISAEYRDQLTATDPTLTLSVWGMVPSAAAPPASAGPHTYTLSLTASSTSAAPSTVTATNVQVNAIDLGRS